MEITEILTAFTATNIAGLLGTPLSQNSLLVKSAFNLASLPSKFEYHSHCCQK